MIYSPNSITNVSVNSIFEDFLALFWWIVWFVVGRNTFLEIFRTVLPYLDLNNLSRYILFRWNISIFNNWSRTSYLQPGVVACTCDSYFLEWCRLNSNWCQWWWWWWWRWWWWWIVFTKWLTNEGRLTLFPSGVIVKDFHHIISSTHHIISLTSIITSWSLQIDYSPLHVLQFVGEFCDHLFKRRRIWLNSGT